MPTNFKLLTTQLIAFFTLLCATQAHCADLHFQVLGVDAKPIQNAVIYLDHLSRDEKNVSNKIAVMDQQDKNFVPHLLVVAQGTSIDFENTDSVNHYVYSFSEPKKFQFKLFKGEKNLHTVLFDQPGLITLGCNIHDFMLGYILVVPTHYFAVTDKIGKAQMSVPDNNEIVIKLWHERANENLDSLSQSITITSDENITFSFHKTLKPERRASQKEENY